MKKSKVRSGKLIEFEGVSEADLVKIKDLLINKVESQEKDLSILDIPAEETPSKVIIHENFINFNDAELENFYNSHGFALGLDDLEIHSGILQN